MYKVVCVIIKLHMKKRELQNISTFALLLIKGRVGNIFNLILKKNNSPKTLKAFQDIERGEHTRHFQGYKYVQSFNVL